MATKIRLTRMGAKKAPFYRIVVADSRARRDGAFIDITGTYDPNRQPAAVESNAEKAEKWLSTGAQPSDTVKSLLKQQGLWK